MPEMPEVETMVRDLTARVVGRTVTRFEAPFFGSFVYPPSPSEVESRLVGQQIVGVSRRGKYAGFALASGDALIIHRGMTGSLLLRRPQDPPEGHVRLIFGLDDDAELRFNDPRKFGKAFLMEATGAERPLPWQRMGPEPLNGDFTPSTLRKGLEGRTATIKPLLLNQQVVAGLGNIYVDEALYRARIHPERRANTLRPAEIKRLHGAIQEVLQAAIEGRGTTFSSYTDIEGRQGAYQRSLQVFQRAGQPCERCGSEIVKLVVGGRGTHVCPSCQRV
jgi:formamidopyrimidine-DNA glycosylase